MQRHNLNEDCFHMIFQYLGFSDLVRAGMTCKSFQQIVRRFIRKLKIQTWEIDACSALFTHRAFFAAYGADIRTITVDFSVKYRDWAQLVTEFCPNLEHMTVYMGDHKLYDPSFIGVSRNLRSLCIQGSDRCSEIGQEINKLQCLQLLRITVSAVSLASLDRLAKLTDLKLANCLDLTTEMFARILKSNRNLKKVYVYDCPKVQPIAYRVMVETQKQLESLGITGSILGVYNFIPKLQGIKKLTILRVYNRQLAGKILQDLSHHLANSLECFTCINWQNIDFPQNLSFPLLTKLNIVRLFDGDINTTLGRVAVACKRLRKIKIYWGDSIIRRNGLLGFLKQAKNLVYAAMPIKHLLTIELYMEIVEMRKKHNNPEPLHLAVTALSWEFSTISRAGVVNSIKENESYTEMKRYVEVSTFPLD